MLPFPLPPQGGEGEGGPADGLQIRRDGRAGGESRSERVTTRTSAAPGEGEAAPLSLPRAGYRRQRRTRGQ